MQFRETKDNLIDLSVRNDEAPRSPGLHLSDLVYAHALRIGYYKAGEDWEDLDHLIRSTNTKQADSGTLNRILLGLAFEDWLGHHLAKRIDGFVYHPGELNALSPDDVPVTGTPDAWEARESVNGGWYMHLHEFKLTWKPAVLPHVAHKPWLWQLQAYSYMGNSGPAHDGMVGASLWVYYVNGPFSRGRPMPMLKRYDYQFSYVELVSNWATLGKYAKEQE